MSVQIHIIIALIACPLAIFLAACEQTDEPTESSPTQVSEPTHPWDWEPTEAELIAGKEVYTMECSLCHNEGEEGAPALTKTEEWATRSAKGLPTLIDHAINGFTGDDGKMPARGGTDTLTDAEVASAVKFMVAAPK